MTQTQLLDQICGRLGIKLPPPPKPVGSYKPLILKDNMAYLSGQISKDSEGKILTGKLGTDLNLDDGKKAARLALLQAMSLIHSEIGLNRINQVIRLVGYVQSAPDFYGQSDVMNGASELLTEIFGEKGFHVRSSVGVASLPLNAAVEIELTLKIQ